MADTLERMLARITGSKVPLVQQEEPAPKAKKRKRHDPVDDDEEDFELERPSDDLFEDISEPTTGFPFYVYKMVHPRNGTSYFIHDRWFHHGFARCGSKEEAAEALIRLVSELPGFSEVKESMYRRRDMFKDKYTFPYVEYDAQIRTFENPKAFLTNWRSVDIKVRGSRVPPHWSNNLEFYRSLKFSGTANKQGNVPCYAVDVDEFNLGPRLAKLRLARAIEIVKGRIRRREEEAARFRREQNRRLRVIIQSKLARRELERRAQAKGVDNPLRLLFRR